MNIENITFEKPIFIEIKGQIIKLIAFKMEEHGNIKFGLSGPKNININREEILIQKNIKNTTKNL